MFGDGDLSEDQKKEATTVITNTQSLLANTSFQVLGLERGELSQEEVLAVLAEYRNSGNMTQIQNNQIQQLAVDTQVLLHYATHTCFTRTNRFRIYLKDSLSNINSEL